MFHNGGTTTEKALFCMKLIHGIGGENNTDLHNQADLYGEKL